MFSFIGGDNLKNLFYPLCCSEHSDGPGAGGNLLEGGGSNLHPSRMPMGNLAPTLRRSMPAVNAQQQQQNWGGTSQAQHKTASRHMSFSIDQQQEEEGEREKRRQLATNADEGEGPEEASARQRTAAAKDKQGSVLKNCYRIDLGRPVLRSD